MQARLIGQTQSSSVGLGGANWSLDQASDDRESIRTIHAALDAGVRLIDTARAYSRANDDGHNERLIRRALAGRTDREDVLVATKGGHYRDGDRFPVDGGPDALARDVRRSLSALGVPRIGLYILHKPDPLVPIEESVGRLAELQRAGDIGMIGLSNVDEEQLARAATVAEIVAVQNRFSLLDRESAWLLDRTDLAFLAYSPLGGTGGLRRIAERFPQVERIAQDNGLSMANVATSWVTAQSSRMIAIVGASHPSSILGVVEDSHPELAEQTLATI